MGDFQANYVKVDGLNETIVGRSNLSAETIEQVKAEAINTPAHDGSNMIDIYREGQKVCRIGVGF